MSKRRVFTLVFLLFLIVAWVGNTYAKPKACKMTIAATTSWLSQNIYTVYQKCEARRVSGAIPFSIACIGDLRVERKIERLKLRAGARIRAKCAGPDNMCGTTDDDAISMIGWDIGQCPNIESASCSGAIQNCDDINTCVICVGESTVRNLVRTISGRMHREPRSGIRRCQHAISKEARIFFNTRLRILNICRNNVFRNVHVNNCPFPGGGGAEILLARAEHRKVQRLCKACGGGDFCGRPNDVTPVQIGFIDQCPLVQVPRGRSCARDIHTFGDLLGCVDCIIEFATTCLDVLAVPSLTSYPAECTPAAPLPLPSTTSTTCLTNSTSSTTSSTSTTCPIPSTSSTSTTSTSTSTSTSTTRTSTSSSSTSTSSTSTSTTRTSTSTTYRPTSTTCTSTSSTSTSSSSTSTSTTRTTVTTSSSSTTITITSTTVITSTTTSTSSTSTTCTSSTSTSSTSTSSTSTSTSSTTSTTSTTTQVCGQEMCNGEDDDCDGRIDEGNPGGNQWCDTGLKGVCRDGMTYCSFGRLVCTTLIYPGSSLEICNGKDDNCDGLIDDSSVCTQ